MKIGGVMSHVVTFLMLLFAEPFKLSFCSKIHNLTCIQSERQALLRFKQNLKDPSNRLSGWTAVEDCCRWDGIVCSNVTGHVIELHLGSSHVGGMLSPSMLDLKHLTYLDLSDNDFGLTQIPTWFWNMVSDLYYLNISRNQFHGNIPDLLTMNQPSVLLDLSSNNFSGSLLVNGLLTDLLQFVTTAQKSNRLVFISFVSTCWAILTEQWYWPKHLAFGLHRVVDPACNFVIPSLIFLFSVRLSFLPSFMAVPTDNSAHSGDTNDAVGTSSADGVSGDSTFANKQISIKLDDTNFLLWKQQVVLMIRGHDLEHLLDESTPIPPKVVTDSNGQISLNPGYRRFKKLDSSLASWLLSTISPNILPQLVGAETTAAIWSTLVKQFSKLSTTKVMNLHCRLRALKKGSLSVRDYTTQIKEICDLLATSGSPVSEVEQIATVLNGLPIEFEPFIAAITVSREPYTLETVTSVLMDAESRLADPMRIPVGINLTRFSSSDSSGVDSGRRVEQASSDSSVQFAQQHDRELPSSEQVIHGHSQLQEQSAGGSTTLSSHGETSVVAMSVDPTNEEAMSVDHLVPPCSGQNATLDAGVASAVPDLSVEMHSSDHSSIEADPISVQPSLTVNTTLDGTATSNDANLPLVREYNPFNIHFLVSPSVIAIDLSFNSLSGSMLRFLCYKLNESMNLEILNLGHNLLSGEIPECWNKYPRLVGIKLCDNSFSGKIPGSMGALTSLQSLHIRNNSFIGEIPSSLRNCSELITVDFGSNKLSGDIPPWMGKSLPKLIILSLHTNMFTGTIPEQICNLSYLQILDLSHNNLVGNKSDDKIFYKTSKGSFFEDILVVMKGRVVNYGTTLNLVKTMDLSDNNLAGEIPEQATSLAGLQSLNFSHNHLVGKIPDNIGAMESLECFDLSTNNLSGEIPLTISDLTFLSHLNLSYNKFTGKIPTGTQLQSMNAYSFLSTELFGPPLSEGSSGHVRMDTSSSAGRSLEDQHGINWFFLNIELGFCLGFLGVLVFVMFCKSAERLVHFQYVDEVGYSLGRIIRKYNLKL
ncbi:hypothetical protein GQ457_05G027740 [Hibiscus cannabinus]